MKYVEIFKNITPYSISPSRTPHPFTPASQIPQRDHSSVNPALVMPRNCVDSADNFCYICGEVTLQGKKGHHRDSEKGVSFVFRMQDQRPRQILGPAHMLQ